MLNYTDVCQPLGNHREAIHIGQIVQDAAIFDFKNWRTLQLQMFLLRDDDLAQGYYKSLPVDFLLTRNLLFEKVKRHYATSQPFVERQIPCATVEGLLLLKLYALPALYRMGNFSRVGLYENDIATLLQAYRPKMKPLLSELSQHLSESDLQSVREIVEEIENRLKRFENQLD